MKVLKKVFCSILILIISFSFFGCEGLLANISSITTNYVELINEVSAETMKSVIMVKTDVNTLTKKNTYLGSAVIVKIVENTFNSKTNKTCYAITNNHVVQIDAIYGVTRTVTDYQGNAYDYKVERYSANDDLAIISFAYNDDIDNNELKALPFAKNNYRVGGRVISLGSPHGQKNTITLGVITDYDTVTMSPENDNLVSNVQYEVIHHTCPIDGGSSGGVLINYNFEIVGINFAAGISEKTGDFVAAYAIPVEKVIAFIGTTLD